MAEAAGALGIVVMGITSASIVLGQLVPKRIAMQYPETVATLIAPAIQWLSKIVSPFVKVLSVATNAPIYDARFQPAISSLRVVFAGFMRPCRKLVAGNGEHLQERLL